MKGCDTFVIRQPLFGVILHLVAHLVKLVTSAILLVAFTTDVVALVTSFVSLSHLFPQTKNFIDHQTRYLVHSLLRIGGTFARRSRFFLNLLLRRL